jgi:hypothetical protein
MPYFVFSVRPFAQIEKLAEFAAFNEASTHAKSLRAARSAGDGAQIKVMFADHQQIAEDLLCEVRQPGPTGDD